MLERDLGIQRGIAKWAEIDPRAASAWVAQMPEGIARDYASMNLISNWSRYQSQAAADWIRSLQDGHQRDVAIEEFVRSNAVRDGAAAWDLAMTVTDQGKRIFVQSLAMGAWAEQEPVKAEAALTAMEEVPNDVSSAYASAIETREAWREFFLGRR